MNERLRKQVKLLKALQDITYTEIAEYMEMPKTSFYNWLCGNYNFGTTKLQRLNSIVSDLAEYRIGE